MIINFIINAFLLITFWVMCAGFAAFFKQELGINTLISGSLFALFSYFLLNKDTKGVFILNWILIPIMIAILVMLGIKGIESNLYMTQIQNNRKLDYKSNTLCKLQLNKPSIYTNSNEKMHKK